MAHTVYGIDIGSYAVKAAVLEVAFRHSRMVGFFEEVVPEGDAPLADRQGDALRRIAARLPAEAMVYVAMPGEALSFRVLALPFSDARKIEQVVGYELEGQIVSALEDVVFDHVVVRSDAEGSTVMAVAGRRDDVSAFLTRLREHGMEPRGVYAAPLAYRALPEAAAAVAPTIPIAAAENDAVAPAAGGDGGAGVGAGDGRPAAGCQVLLDLGHTRTNVSILHGGEVLYARTILRGGLHLTQAMAKAFSCSFEQAEEGKRHEGFVASAALPAATPLRVKLDAVLREELAPLLRDIRQTVASFRASSKIPVTALLVTGGTARLGGLPEYLAEELELPARALLTPADGGGGESAGRALATAIAWTAARGKKEIDLRRGPFVYRARFSVLRGKTLHVATLAVALIVAASLDTMAALSRLNKEKAEVDLQFKNATIELFGEAKSDARAVTLLLKKGFKEEMAPVPKATAFDLLDQISKKMPSGDRVKLDVMELDIRPKKTFVKGTADSAAAVDEIAAKLKEIDCYEDVTKGAITEVSGAKQFTLTVASKCP